MPPLRVHMDNRPIMLLNFEGQSWIYIGKMWAHRRQRRVRDLIHAHLDRISRWRRGAPGSLGMSVTPRDPDAGDSGIA